MHAVEQQPRHRRSASRRPPKPWRNSVPPIPFTGTLYYDNCCTPSTWSFVSAAILASRANYLPAQWVGLLEISARTSCFLICLSRSRRSVFRPVVDHVSLEKLSLSWIHAPICLNSSFRVLTHRSTVHFLPTLLINHSCYPIAIGRLHRLIEKLGYDVKSARDQCWSWGTKWVWSFWDRSVTVIFRTIDGVLSSELLILSLPIYKYWYCSAKAHRCEVTISGL